MTSEELSDLAIELAKYIERHPYPHATMEDRIKVLSQVSGEDLFRVTAWTKVYLPKLS